MRLLLILLSLFALTACAPHHHHHHHKTVEVHHLADGRCVYRDDSGMIWWYMYMMNTSSPSATYNTAAHSYAYYAAPTVTSLPQGGAWVSAKELKETPQEEEQLEMELNDPRATVIETPVETTANGALIEPVQEEEQMEMDLGETNETTSETSESTSESSTSDSSSPSDSSTSDSSSSSDGGSSGPSDSA